MDELACASFVSELRAAARRGPVAVACEPSPEGVLSAVGASYLAAATDATRLVRNDRAQAALGETLLVMEPDPALARRVSRGIDRAVTDDGRIRLRTEVLGGRPSVEWARPRAAIMASCCDHDDAPDAVFRYARLALRERGNTHLLVSSPEVARFSELVSHASGELEHTKQFVRFSHMADGTYFATFRPTANVVPLALPHFAHRMGRERFCVLDPSHLVATLYDGSRERPQRAIVRLTAESARTIASRTDLAADERYVRALWKRFYDAMALPRRGKEERGYDLRMHLEPKRFWDGLTELDPQNDDPGTFVPARYQGNGTRP